MFLSHALGLNIWNKVKSKYFINVTFYFANISTKISLHMVLNFCTYCQILCTPKASKLSVQNQLMGKLIPELSLCNSKITLCIELLLQVTNSRQSKVYKSTKHLRLFGCRSLSKIFKCTYQSPNENNKR